jgi:hypothetical protein
MKLELIVSKVEPVAGNVSSSDQNMSVETDPTARFRAEFRHRETDFLKRQARRVAIVERLPRWLHWLVPAPTRSRFW